MTVLATPRAVLFDMTGTLHGQRHVATAAMAAIQHVLDTLDADVAPTLAEAVRAVHHTMRTEFERRAPSGFYLLRDILVGGHRAAWTRLDVEVDDATIASAIDTFESTFVRVVEPYAGAVDVLALIREHGIATAIVSVNDEQLLQDAVDACGLRPYVDIVLSSEAVRSCKPEPAMFVRALEALGVAPGDAVFVGDMPEMDVVGAKRVGMRTVLTTEDSGFLSAGDADGDEFVPDAVIATITELPTVLGLPPVGVSDPGR